MEERERTKGRLGGENEGGMRERGSRRGKGRTRVEREKERGRERGRNPSEQSGLGGRRDLREVWV